MEADEGHDGRRRRFRVLYEEAAPAVARYAARRVAAADVHDVVAETFLVAWRRFDDVPSDSLPWLFGTARKVIANRRRSESRRRALDARLTTELASSPAQEPPSTGVDRELLTAIAELPDSEREAFVLVAWDGLDPERAAQAAGCRAGTFRMRLHRARRRLERRLTDQQGPVEVRTTLEDPR
jgi:RNA polymerase sigma factor (sigma-70 family)